MGINRSTLTQEEIAAIYVSMGLHEDIVSRFINNGEENMQPKKEWEAGIDFIGMDSDPIKPVTVVRHDKAHKKKPDQSDRFFKKLRWLFKK